MPLTPSKLIIPASMGKEGAEIPLGGGLNKTMESLLRDGIEALEKGAPPAVHQAIEIGMREEIARIEREVQSASARLDKLHQMRKDRGDFDDEEEEQ